MGIGQEYNMFQCPKLLRTLQTRFQKSELFVDPIQFIQHFYVLLFQEFDPFEQVFQQLVLQCFHLHLTLLNALDWDTRSIWGRLICQNSTFRLDVEQRQTLQYLGIGLVLASTKILETLERLRSKLSGKGTGALWHLSRQNQTNQYINPRTSAPLLIHVLQLTPHPNRSMS